LGPSKLDAYLDAVDRWQRATAAGSKAASSSSAAAAMPPPAPPAPPLDSDCFDALEGLGLYLYRDAALFTRVLRALRHHVASYCCHGAGRAAAGAAGGESAVAEAGGDFDGGGVGVGRVYRLLAHAILPALSMVPANFAVSNAAWEVMRLLPFAARFAIYRQAHEFWAETPLVQVRACLGACVGGAGDWVVVGCLGGLRWN